MMGALSIIKHAMDSIIYELSEGLMVDAVLHWQTMGEALGKCVSTCGSPFTPATEKCAECLAGKLISESNAHRLSEEERQRYIYLARELKVWVDLGQR